MPTVATGITEPSGSMKDCYAAAAAAGVGDDHDDHVDVDIDHHHNHPVDDHDERESNVMKAVMDESCKKKHQFDRDPASARCQGWVTI